VKATRAATDQVTSQTAADRAVAALKTSEALLTGEGGLEERVADAARAQERTQAADVRAATAFETGRADLFKAKSELDSNRKKKEEAASQRSSSQQLEAEAALKKDAAKNAAETADAASKVALAEATASSSARQKADEAERVAAAAQDVVDCEVAGSTCKKVNDAESLKADAEQASAIAANAANEAKVEAEGELLTKGMAAMEAVGAAQVLQVQANGELGLTKAAASAAGATKVIAADAVTDTTKPHDKIEKAQEVAEASEERLQGLVTKAANEEHLAAEKKEDDTQARLAIELAAQEAQTRLEADENAADEAQGAYLQSQVDAKSAKAIMQDAQSLEAKALSSHKTAEASLADAKESADEQIATGKAEVSKAEVAEKVAQDDTDSKAEAMQQANGLLAEASTMSADANAVHIEANGEATKANAEKDSLQRKITELGFVVTSKKNIMEADVSVMAGLQKQKEKIAQRLSNAEDVLTAADDLTKSKATVEAKKMEAVRQMEASDKIRALKAAEAEVRRLQKEQAGATQQKLDSERELSTARVEIESSTKALLTAEDNAQVAADAATNALPGVSAAADAAQDSKSASNAASAAASALEVEITQAEAYSNTKDQNVEKAEDTLKRAQADEAAKAQAAEDAKTQIQEDATKLEAIGAVIEKVEEKLGELVSIDTQANVKKDDFHKQLAVEQESSNHLGDLARSAEEAASAAEGNAEDKVSILKQLEVQAKDLVKEVAHQQKVKSNANKGVVKAKADQAAAHEKVTNLEREDVKAQEEVDEASDAKKMVEQAVSVARHKHKKQAEAKRVAEDKAAEEAAAAAQASAEAVEAQKAVAADRAEAAEAFKKLQDAAEALKSGMLKGAQTAAQGEINKVKDEATRAESDAKDQANAIHTTSQKVVQDLMKEYNKKMANVQTLLTHVEKAHSTNQFVDSSISKAQQQAANIVAAAEDAADKAKKAAQAQADTRAAEQVQKESDAAATAILEKAKAEAAAESIPVLLLEIAESNPVLDTLRAAMKSAEAIVNGGESILKQGDAKAEKMQANAIDAAAVAAEAKQQAVTTSKVFDTTVANLAAEERAAAGPRKRFEAATEAKRQLTEALAQAHADDQAAQASEQHAVQTRKAAEKRLTEIDTEQDNLKKHTQESKLLAEEGVTNARSAKSEANSRRARADEQANNVEEMRSENDSSIKAAQEASAERREAETELATEKAGHSELQNSLQKGKEETTKSTTELTEAVTVTKEEEEAADKAREDARSAASAVKARWAEHAQAVKKTGNLQAVTTKKEAAEGQARKAWSALDKVATEKSNTVIEAKKRLANAEDNSKKQHELLEGAVETLKTSTDSLIPARAAVDAAMENTLEERAALETARLEHESAHVALVAAQKKVTNAKGTIADVKKEKDANQQSIGDLENKTVKLSNDVITAQAGEQEARDQHAAAEHNTIEKMEAVTVAAAAANTASEKKQVAATELKTRTEHHDKALANLGATKQEVTLARDALAGAEANTEAVLAMPQSLVQNTGDRVKQTKAAADAAKEADNRVKETEATAKMRTHSTQRTVADTKRAIAKKVPMSTAESEHAETLVKLDELERELKATKALRDQLAGEYATNKERLAAAKATLITTTTADAEAISAEADANNAHDKAKEDTNKVKDISAQDVTNMETAKKAAQDAAAEAATKLQNLNDAQAKLDNALLKNNAAKEKYKTKESRAKLLENEASGAENSAAAAQSASTSAASAQQVAETNADATQQAAAAALEQAQKLDGQAAAAQETLDAAADKAAEAVQPLKDEYQKARDAASTAADNMQHLTVEHELQKQQKTFATLTKETTTKELEEANAHKAAAVSEVNAANVAVQEFGDSEVQELGV